MRENRNYSEPRPPFLDAAGAAERLTELGLPCSERQMRRYFDERRLPWFKAPDGRRYIAANTLEEWLKAAQRDAIRALR